MESDIVTHGALRCALRRIGQAGMSGVWGPERRIGFLSLIYYLVAHIAGLLCGRRVNAQKGIFIWEMPILVSN